MSTSPGDARNPQGFYFRGLEELIDRLTGAVKQRHFESSLQLRQGVITAVPGNATVSVQVGGDATVLVGIPYIGSAPSVGNLVMLLQQGSLLYVLGVPSR